jgi:beta-N-acetylhexosaminidase
LRSAWQKNWANDLRRAGVTVNFAPVADVVPASLGTSNEPIGRYRREFGHRPSTVASHATAALSGMQAAGLMATAKHFPGLGRVRRNTDTSRNVVDRTTTADDPYLRPFRAAVAAGTTFVMVSSAKYTKIDPKRKAVFSPVVMRLLREDLGFEGVIVSDDLGAAEQVAATPYGERALRFLAAGGQLVVVVGPPRAVRAMSAAVVARARRDDTVRARVDDAVRALLTVKRAHGLIPASVCR